MINKNYEIKKVLDQIEENEKKLQKYIYLSNQCKQTTIALENEEAMLNQVLLDVFGGGGMCVCVCVCLCVVFTNITKVV